MKKLIIIAMALLFEGCPITVEIQQMTVYTTPEFIQTFMG